MAPQAEASTGPIAKNAAPVHGSQFRRHSWPTTSIAAPVIHRIASSRHVRARFELRTASTPTAAPRTANSGASAKLLS